jgi:hypothetical protein
MNAKRDSKEFIALNAFEFKKILKNELKFQLKMVMNRKFE